MAAELCLPDPFGMGVVCDGGRGGGGNSARDGEFSGREGGDGQSGEEFEDGLGWTAGRQDDGMDILRYFG